MSDSTMVAVPVPEGNVLVTVRWHVSKPEFDAVCDAHGVPQKDRIHYPGGDDARDFWAADVTIEGRKVQVFGGFYARRLVSVDADPVAA